MADFESGDRVRSLESQKAGYVISTHPDGYIDIKFDDRTYGELPPQSVQAEANQAG